MPMNKRKWNLDTLVQFLSITIGLLQLGSCNHNLIPSNLVTYYGLKLTECQK